MITQCHVMLVNKMIFSGHMIGADLEVCTTKGLRALVSKHVSVSGRSGAFTGRSKWHPVAAKTNSALWTCVRCEYVRLCTCRC